MDQRVEPATAPERMFARAIDFVVLLVPIFVIDLALRAITSDPASLTLLRTLITTAAFFTYSAALETSAGATIGKRLLRLRVQMVDRSSPSIAASLRRNAFYALNLIALIPITAFQALAGFLLLATFVLIGAGISRDVDHRRGIHDRFGDTVVVRISD